MSKAEEIATNQLNARGASYQGMVASVNDALEWAAQQCEAEAPFANSDQSLIANACAERIRAGKSGRPA